MSLKNSSSYDFPEETPKPPRGNSAEAFLALLLAVGIVLIILRVPSVNAFVKKMIERRAHPVLAPSALVWAKKDAGVYYCSNSALYGSGIGTYMKQGDALTAGYQPALGNYCGLHNPVSSEKNTSAAQEVYRGKRSFAVGSSDPQVLDAAGQTSERYKEPLKTRKLD